MLPNVLRPNATDHVPVLADEVREALAVQPGETVVDATFGAGGHATLLAADLHGQGKVIAIDRDPTVRPYFDRVKAASRGVQARFLRGDHGVVLSQLAAIFHIPGWSFVVLTLAVPALLAWSAAVVTSAISSEISARRARARLAGPA